MRSPRHRYHTGALFFWGGQAQRCSFRWLAELSRTLSAFGNRSVAQITSCQLGLLLRNYSLYGLRRRTDDSRSRRSGTGRLCLFRRCQRYCLRHPAGFQLPSPATARCLVPQFCNLTSFSLLLNSAPRSAAGRPMVFRATRLEKCIIRGVL